MKGYFHGLRGRQVHLILIGLVCTTLVIWASDKTSFLTSLLPPRTRILLLPREEVKSIQIVGENSTEQSGNIVDLLAPVTSTSTNRSSYVTAAKNATTTKDRKQEVTQNFVRGMDQRQAFEESNSSRPAEKSFADHVSSTGMNSSIRRDDDSNLTTHVEKRACNYAKGKWLSDDSLPLYSGFGCKQWLSGMWACRLTQRKDFEYEKLRWQPKDCEMEGFTAAKFLERMQNKTLVFVGDSLGRQQFQSLMCMVTGGEERPDVVDVGQRYGLVKARGAKRPDGWAYKFPSTNTTILYYWSASLCDLEPIDITNPVTEYAMHLDRPPSFLHRFIHEFDVLVLNTGHHWNRGKLNANRWVMYVGGVPNTNKRIASIGGAKNFTIYSIINWVNSQLQKYPGLKAFYRSISPRHFVNGDWNSGGSCDNTTPLSVGKEVSEDESRDLSAAGAVRGTKVKLLDITSLSQIRDEGHISRYSITASPGAQDCLHWCLPGVPDTWNEVLFAQL